MFIGQAGENQVEFVIKDYQSPEQPRNYFEANWLMVQIHVRTASAQWQAEAPVMLTSELNCFVDWLQALCENVAPNRFFDFEEPSLYVCVTDRKDELLTLEFHFHLEFRCPREQGNETRVAVTMRLSELEEWVRYLKQRAEELPVRYVFDM